jgi:hypothetical protein
VGQPYQILISPMPRTPYLLEAHPLSGEMKHNPVKDT